MAPRSSRSKENVRRGRSDQSSPTYSPKLKDFRRRGEQQDQDKRVKVARSEPIAYSNPKRRMNDIFDNFRSDIEDVMMTPWFYSSASPSSLYDWRFPSLFRRGREEEQEIMTRAPIFDIVDKGEKYELQAELPGIDKDGVNVKASKDSIEITAEHSEEEKTQDKRKKYVYNERSYTSFYRNIPFPEEIISSKVSARMNNGILRVDIPKKNPTKVEEEVTRVKID
jgi:HSP20 family protein